MPAQIGLPERMESAPKNFYLSGMSQYESSKWWDPEYGAPGRGPWGWQGGSARGMGGESGIRDLQESAIAKRLLENKDFGYGRTWAYAKGKDPGTTSRMELQDWLGATNAARAERSFLAGEAAKEKAYDQAAADVEFAKELAAKKTAPGAMAEEAIAKGSGAQAAIAGGTQAGRTLAGEFKSQYETGSVLPASWMKNIDTEETATKVSGLVGPRTGAYQATYQGGTRGGGVTQVKPGEYAGSGAQQFSRSAVQKLAPTRTGLGRTV